MPCLNCGKELPEGNNWCSWECQIESAKKVGKVHAPNGLPVCCIRADGHMFEHEHGDHPDYKRPVTVEYVGDIQEDHRQDFEVVAGRVAKDDGEIREYLREVHALIYTDGFVAVTLYECNYAMWSVSKGDYLGGRYNSKDHRITAEDCYWMKGHQKPLDSQTLGP